ncbi:MAG: 50S ribosomal protein L35 [Candidatus Firestonebacteria bacterium]|nr:50S ribosomal protein L35 [Candidatus Firestonebacteria bacterium]
MPKLKTNKGAAKRFKITKSGSVKRNKAFGNHILTKKSSKRKRLAKQRCMTSKTEEKNIKKLIPYL